VFVQRNLIALAAACLLSHAALAENVTIENAWVRATAPGQQVAGGFMDLTADADMTLVGGSSPVSNSLELHFMRMENGVMEMREMKEIALPRGKTVKLEPGDLHVMFIGLKHQIKPDQTVPLTLHVKGADGRERKLEVRAEVRKPGRH
jgi:periplasmic copper chaperone A